MQPNPRLPVVSPEAAFVPFHEVAGRPHVVVDGPASAGTVLGLSHWPDGGVPDDLAADTSAEIVANYLDADAAGPAIGIVTNNHFDEDGLLAAWLLLERPDGDARRLAIRAAEAGDFHTWSRPRDAWAALALMAAAERATTPFPDVLRALNGAHGQDPAGAITIALLPRVEAILGEPERFRRLWEPRWHEAERAIETLDSGAATIEEIPGADLAIVRAPSPLSPLAVCPRVGAMRLINATGDGLLWLEHRYETWVRYASRPLPPRVDLAPVLDTLQQLETLPGTWRFEGVAAPKGRLAFVDANGAPTPSGLSPERLAQEVSAGSNRAESG
jgi:hypothetical protein